MTHDETVKFVQLLYPNCAIHGNRRRGFMLLAFDWKKEVRNVLIGQGPSILATYRNAAERVAAIIGGRIAP